ncbi:tetratricopeptide repeat protein [Meiothermus ruber]|jgi:tetratricopeptide (TPR) repeat protein|uniref:SARP family transcriptional regulator n=1 Tax=Meiothermus ruber (strain ATCC 35948 / DSM 1279 / VKM B-1258 / 21) TaxID=504728 RepID=D3PPF3_MEIRD|nr:tetratricopeptide repeat protein [Meiothermus ruber]ADD27562.1 transcriptional regulator, SARP family [Meiothermus ruber DSM 1279]AGK04027.1 SARP family transcriptional regulator [Meiothermus ruber DSM 1279]MCL6529880.1 tetratricopeptide repeat protein [Meiothermus ruber]
MLRTLGKLALEHNPPNHRNPFQKKPLLLLAYLCLEGPRSRRHLAELFWPGASDGLNSLSVALSRLRSAGLPVTGEEILSTAVPCDALELQKALAQGKLDEARQLYGGRFLEGADEGLSPELEEWVWSKREALALALWQAHQRQAEALAGLGWSEEGEALLQSALELPGVLEVVDEKPQLRAFPPEVQRAFFAVQWVGLSKAIELLSIPVEALDFLINQGLLDAQGRPLVTAPPNLQARKVALELARQLPLGEAAPLYKASRAHWEEADRARGRLALLRLARNLVDERPQEALALLADLAADAELLFLRARALERLGRYREALELLDELPPSPDRSALRGSVLLRLGHLAEARTEAEATAEGSLFAQAEGLNLQGMMLLGQGRFQEAAEAFSRAAVRFLMAGEEVRHLGALSNRAVALAELGQGEEAFAEVLAAIGAREGLRARVYLNLGVVRERQGRLEEAEQLYRESLALAQGNLEAMGRAWNNLGALYHRQGKAAEAKTAYQEALRLARAGQEWVLTAAVLANLAELTGERASLEEAITLLEEARYTVLAERYRNRLAEFRPS